MISRSVVITGIGVVSPVGIGVDAFWESLMAGQSGVREREDFRETEGPFRIAAPVIGFEGKQYVKPRKAIKIMCQPIQFGYGAARMAADQAGLNDSLVDPDRIGTVFGTETFFADPKEVADVFRKCIVDSEYQHDRWGEFAMREIQPLWMLKYLPNMVASHISIALDARGPSNSICQGEASGLLAIIEGTSLIERGIADVVIAGGTGSRMSLNSMLYRGTDLLSRRFLEPEKASRPFDRDRDGMVVGEGAGAIVLESREHAEKRGATPLAEIVGWARTHTELSRPDLQETISACMSEALTRSNIDISNLGHVNAHASGAIDLDMAEANAIHRVMKDKPVVALKSYFGNVGPGTSAVETIGSLQAMSSGVLPKTLNFENKDSQAPDLNVVCGSGANAGDSFLKSSISFTGQVVTAAFTKSS